MTKSKKTVKRERLNGGRIYKPARVKKETNPRPFEPSQEQCRLVAMLASYGIKQRDICQFVVNPHTNKPIDVGTLERRFGDQLAMGLMHARVQVAESLFRKCIGQPAQYEERVVGGKKKLVLVQAYIPPDLGAIIWWEKTRLGFKEGMIFEHVGEDGQKLDPAHQTIVILPANGRESPGQVFGSPVLLQYQQPPAGNTKPNGHPKQ